MNDVTRRALRSSLFGVLALAALLFVPAGTLDYWQAWLFMAVFVCTSGAITAYLAIPKLLERRMNVGPRAEKEPAQKIIMVLATLGFMVMLVFPVLDHRFGWSPVSASMSILGDVLLIALGFLFIFFVFRENSYGASTIQVTPGGKPSLRRARMRSCGIRCMPGHSSCSSAHRSRSAHGGDSSHFSSYRPF